MNVTEDFISVEGKRGLKPAGPALPTLFGLTLTPMMIGVLIMVLGLVGGLYLIFNQLIPASEKSQKLQADLAQKQAQVQQKASWPQKSEQVKTQLVQAKQQQVGVLNLFANEKILDTLLLDLNQLVEFSNAKVSQNDVRAKLKRFVPVNQSSEVITDSSLGSEVNGKLKSRVFNVAFEGTFEQTETIIRNIERLQPLLIVKDYQSTLAPSPAPDAKGRVIRGPATITTSFQLQAIMPVSPEEAAKVTAAANQPKK